MLTTKQVCEILNIAQPTLRTLDDILKPKLLPGKTRGFTRLYDPTLVEALRKRRSAEAGYRNRNWRKSGEARKHGPFWASLYRAHLTGAKNREIGQMLSLDRFVELCQQPCEYCGDPPQPRVVAVYKGAANGVDRIDNSSGYIEGNVATCCWMCNRMKSTGSVEEFIRQVYKIYAWVSKL